MADANSIQADVAGVDAASGNPDSWRLVKSRGDRNIGDVVNDPTKGPWTSTHNGKPYAGHFDAFEQIIPIAEQISWRHLFSDGVRRDPGDILIGLGEFLIAQGVFKKSSP